MDLFVYGTLVEEELVFELTGRRFARLPATLHGYRREMVQGGFPRVLPDPAAQVEGFLLCDIDPASLRVLDLYEDEGRLYRRISVSVSVPGGERAAAVYAAPA